MLHSDGAERDANGGWLLRRPTTVGVGARDSLEFFLLLKCIVCRQRSIHYGKEVEGMGTSIMACRQINKSQIGRLAAVNTSLPQGTIADWRLRLSSVN